MALPDLIVGDVHGCADELEDLLKLAQPSTAVLVGDLFTKGPKPLQTWGLIQRHGLQAVLGNHDAFLLKKWGKKSLPKRLRKFCKAAPEARQWLEELPLYRQMENLIIVHAGVHPRRGIEGTTRKKALTMRRFPMSDPNAPFWYDAGWSGPETVVFGHDAMRGLVRREVDGVPVAIGLDSGCVYGRQLSGWIPQEDQILSVPAKHSYVS